MFARRRQRKAVFVTALAVFGSALLLVLALPALAADDELVPIIDRLPEQVLLFGASGGAIVMLLLSVLKHFKIVGPEGKIPTQLANFLLSVLVAAVAGIVAGQTIGTALLTAFASMVSASGLYETVGKTVKKAVGNG